MGWPQTVHVPPVLHAVASCAPAQLVYMKGAEKFEKNVCDLYYFIHRMVVTNSGTLQ